MRTYETRKKVIIPVYTSNGDKYGEEERVVYRLYNTFHTSKPQNMYYVNLYKERVLVTKTDNGYEIRNYPY